MEEKMANKHKGSLSIHTENIFPIIKKWLYSEHDIFLRELISNAIDAMSKRRVVEADMDSSLLKVIVKVDDKNKTIQVIDNGIGMTAEEVEKYINQIAFSGAEEFVDKFKDQQNAIIGHFGLGFYSSFMVAEKVTIDTLSYVPEAVAAFWECDGSTDYSLGKGKRKEVGTTITIHVNKENEDYLDSNKLRGIIEQYCNFMPFPIELDEKVINQKEALWNRKPKDVTEEEYKEFYRNLFHENNDPLFWIHLNVDFPVNLRGILYFPQIKNELDINRGAVKLYCNNVFVADNLKDLVPEFLLLLRGGIDIPDIPLNVSRSFLQHDKGLAQITGFIIKKVSDHLHATFKEDRKKYEEYWENIHPFVKYGVLTNEEFAKAMHDIIIFKSSNNDYVTIEEYKTRNQNENKPYKIYYAASETSQVNYIEMMKQQGIEVVYSSSPLDNHLFQHLEMASYMEKDGTPLQFVRVDSELNDVIVDNSTTEITDVDNKTELDKMEELFKSLLQNDKVKIEVKRLKSDALPGMLVYNEFTRRMREMNQMMKTQGFDLPDEYTFVVNIENSSIKKIKELSEKGRVEDATLLAHYLHDLAVLDQRQLTGEELKVFVERANKVLALI